MPCKKILTCNLNLFSSQFQRQSKMLYLKAYEENNEKNNIYKTALEIALKKLLK